jgi:hypothetical protein
VPLPSIVEKLSRKQSSIRLEIFLQVALSQTNSSAKLWPAPSHHLITHCTLSRLECLESKYLHMLTRSRSKLDPLSLPHHAYTVLMVEFPLPVSIRLYVAILPAPTRSKWMGCWCLQSSMCFVQFLRFRWQQIDFIKSLYISAGTNKYNLIRSVCRVIGICELARVGSCLGSAYWLWYSSNLSQPISVRWLLVFLKRC